MPHNTRNMLLGHIRSCIIPGESPSAHSGTITNKLDFSRLLGREGESSRAAHHIAAALITLMSNHRRRAGWPTAMAGADTGGQQLASAINRHLEEFNPTTLALHNWPSPFQVCNVNTKQPDMPIAFYGATPVEGQDLLLVEDVVTSGATVIKMTQALRNRGYVAHTVYAIVNRGGPVATVKLMQHGIRLVPLFLMEEVMSRQSAA